MIPTLGPKVYKYFLLWAVWNPRDSQPGPHAVADSCDEAEIELPAWWNGRGRARSRNSTFVFLSGFVWAVA